MYSKPQVTKGAHKILWVLPAVLLLLTFVYYPVVESVRLSFYSWDAFNPNATFVGMLNYKNMFADSIFWRSFRNNISYALISLFFQVFISLVLAALLEDVIGRKLRGLFRTIYFIPAAMSITVVGILFSFIYSPQFGLVNSFLGKIGLSSWSHAWLGEEKTAMWSIIAMSQWQSIGYCSVLFVVAIHRIPTELFEAAEIDGAGKIRRFFSLTIPMVREMTALLVIVTISGAFLVFNEVMVMTAGGPNNSSQVLGTLLYRKAFFEDDMGYASAVAVVMFVATFAIAAVQIIVTKKQRES